MDAEESKRFEHHKETLQALEAETDAIEQECRRAFSAWYAPTDKKLRQMRQDLATKTIYESQMEFCQIKDRLLSEIVGATGFTLDVLSR